MSWEELVEGGFWFLFSLEEDTKSVGGWVLVWFGLNKFGWGIGCMAHGAFL